MFVIIYSFRVLFMPLLLSGKNRKHNDIIAKNRFLPSIKEFFQMTLTFTLVVFGWIFFRADSVFMAFDYLLGIFTNDFCSEFQMPTKIVLFVLIMILSEWLQRKKEHALDIKSIRPMFRRMIYIIVVVIIYLFYVDSNAFIYFQF